MSWIVIKRVAFAVPPIEEWYWTGRKWHHDTSKAKKYKDNNIAGSIQTKLAKQCHRGEHYEEWIYMEQLK